MTQPSSRGADEDVLLLVAVLVPGAVLGWLFLDDWVVGLVGLAVAAMVGALVGARTGDALSGVVAGGLAPLFLVLPLPVLPAAGALVSLALVVGAVVVPGLPLQVTAWGVALVASVLVRSPVPAVAMALVWPLRWASVHPVRARMGSVVRDVALLAAAAPAFGLFVVGATGRLPAVSGDGIVGAGWGAVAVGVLLFLAALGIEWSFRAVPPEAEVFLGLVLVGGVAVAWSTVASGVREGAAVGGLVWMFIGYPVALGTRRVLGVAGRWRPFVLLLVALMAALAGSLRVIIT